MGNKEIRINANEFKACLHLLLSFNLAAEGERDTWEFIVLEYLKNKYVGKFESIYTGDRNDSIELVAMLTDIEKDYPQFIEGIPF